jgi:hypothetical protein
MAASPDGSVFCAWLDLLSRKTEVYGARSRDGGATWEPDRLVYRTPRGSVCECCHPLVAHGPAGELLVMWRNQLQGARDLYLARSGDGGVTFAPAEKLGKGTWTLNACPMDGGAVAMGPGNLVESIWMRQGDVFSARPGEVERRLGKGVQGWTTIGTRRRVFRLAHLTARPTLRPGPRQGRHADPGRWCQRSRRGRRGRRLRSDGRGLGGEIGRWDLRRDPRSAGGRGEQVEDGSAFAAHSEPRRRRVQSMRAGR